MISKSLSSIVEQNIIGADVLVSGISLDSRSIESGDLFCAMKGECFDGHNYIDVAVENGASAIAVESADYVKSGQVSYVVSNTLKEQVGEIASRFYDEPTQLLAVTGVTGTNGKTSISSYVAQLYTLLNESCGEIGTLGIRFANKVIETKNTTPDAITLQGCFYQMLQEGVTKAVMEVSSHAMVQNRCKGIHFSSAVYSNISRDHLDYHGSFEAYLAAKLQLFSLPDLPLAIVNLDDAYSGEVIASVNKNAKLLTYSLEDVSADVYLSEIKNSDGAYTAVLHYSGERVEIKTQLVGEFNLYNLLAALIVVSEQGFSVQDVARVSAGVRPVSGRMESVNNRHGISAVVDYAHTPDALENVLKSLSQTTAGKIITVFGCGGDRDKGKRPVMASIAEKYSDYVVITSDNPRNEQPAEINQQVESGLSTDNDCYSVCEDRERAIQFAVEMALQSDCVLVAGKGHEKTQLIGDQLLPFDDVQVLASALEKKKVLPC